jgi:hypothetical protein
LFSTKAARPAAEFQKIVNHRGIVASDPIGALARLGLARAYALQDDKVKTRVGYQEFLTIWKDADPDIPIFKQAQTEYAKPHCASLASVFAGAFAYGAHSGALADSSLMPAE